MTRAFKIIATTYVASLAFAGAAVTLNKPAISGVLAAPALIVSALVFGGHLITLDDDYPGGWSNQFSERIAWRSSLRDLGLKFLAFVAAVAVLVIGMSTG